MLMYNRRSDFNFSKVVIEFVTERRNHLGGHAADRIMPRHHRRKRREEADESPSSKRSKREGAYGSRGGSPSAILEFPGKVIDEQTGRVDIERLSANTHKFVDAMKHSKQERKMGRNDSSDIVSRLSREELEARYIELRDVRQTQPERLLAEEKAATQKEHMALKKLVEEYKLQLQLVREEAETNGAGRSGSRPQQENESTKAAVEAREVELRNEFATERSLLLKEAGAGESSGRLSSMVSVFESLTGMRIQMNNWQKGAGEGVICTCFNSTAKKAVRFELKLDDDVDGDEAEWDFVPGSNSNHVLPKYMHDEISFPVSAGPQFLTKVIDALHPSPDKQEES